MIRLSVPRLSLTSATHLNLQACLTAVDEAARASAEILVLPPFANHPPAFESPEHAYTVSTRVPGPFVEEIQERVRIRRVSVVFGVLERGDARPEVFDCRLVIVPNGHLAGMRHRWMQVSPDGSWQIENADTPEMVTAGDIELVLYGAVDSVPAAKVVPVGDHVRLLVYAR